MSKSTKWAIFALRLGLGWLMFYAGYVKVIDPSWSAAGYLTHASTLSGFYTALATPSTLPFINLINEWGLTLLGVSLILGALVRFSSYLGALLMLLYYIPILNFPYVGDHYYLVDEHVIFALILIFFAVIRAGRHYGFDSWLSRFGFLRRFS